MWFSVICFFFQAEDGIRDLTVTGVQTCALPICLVANHLKPGMFAKAGNVGDGAFRRLSQKVDMELPAPVARADYLGRAGGFNCPAMDWFLERAAAFAAEHKPPPPLLPGPPRPALRRPPGPRSGE